MPVNWYGNITQKIDRGPNFQYLLTTNPLKNQFDTCQNVLNLTDNNVDFQKFSRVWHPRAEKGGRKGEEEKMEKRSREGVGEEGGRQKRMGIPTH